MLMTLRKTLILDIRDGSPWKAMESPLPRWALRRSDTLTSRALPSPPFAGLRRLGFMRAIKAARQSDTIVPPPRTRDLQLLLSGSSVSMLGSRVSTIAYPLLVLALTGSPVVAGWAAFAATAPSTLVYLPAGALVDRCDPRRVMLLSEFGRGVAIATVVLALALGSPSVTQLILVAIVEEILEVFSLLAERRLVRCLAEPSKRASTLAWSEARTHVIVLFGRPLGGLLFGLRRVLPFAMDVLSFVFSVGILLKIQKNHVFRRPERAPRRYIGEEIGEGLHWLRSNPLARIALPLTAGATLIGQALIMVFLGQAHAQHLPSVTIGAVLAASGAGGALGSAAAPSLFSHFKYSLLTIQMVAWAAVLTPLALSGGRSSLGMAAAMATFGFTGALGNMALDMFVVNNAAEAVLARVMSVSCLTSFGAVAVGPLLGGFFFERYGVQHAVLVLLIATGFLLASAFAAPATRISLKMVPDLPFAGSSAPSRTRQRKQNPADPAALP